jgi:hypothetical protein
MKYEIQTYSYFGQWENIWNEEGSGSALVFFDTLEEAQKELEGFLEDLAYFVKIGHLEDFNPQEYRIMEVTS